MSAVHFVLQGKGGVGKSVIAAQLAQYFDGQGALECFDTDPINNTFSQYKSLKVKHCKILTGNNNIDPRAFDSLVENILSVGPEGHVVVDNGSATFLPLSSYLVENRVIELLEEYNHKVFIHSILTGGQAMDETIKGLSSLLDQQPAPVTVWENAYFGEVTRDGKAFVDSTLYKNNKDRIHGIIKLHKWNPDTFGPDIALMLNNKLTFAEALESPLFTIMPRLRLKQVQKTITAQLDTLAWQ